MKVNEPKVTWNLDDDTWIDRKAIEDFIDKYVSRIRPLPEGIFEFLETFGGQDGKEKIKQPEYQEIFKFYIERFKKWRFEEEPRSQSALPINSPAKYEGILPKFERYVIDTDWCEPDKSADLIIKGVYGGKEYPLGYLFCRKRKEKTDMHFCPFSSDSAMPLYFPDGPSHLHIDIDHFTGMTNPLGQVFLSGTGGEILDRTSGKSKGDESE